MESTRDLFCEMVAEAEEMRDTHGITTYKVKVGRRPWRLDVDVVRALHEGLGDDVELYVDGNRGWTPTELRGVACRVSTSPVGATKVASRTISSILP